MVSFIPDIERRQREDADTDHHQRGNTGTEERQRKSVLWVVLSRPGTVRATVRGVVGGIIATAMMTVYRFPVFRALPPTSEFWATLRGGEPEQYPLLGLLLHFGYGGAAGGVFGFLFSQIAFRTERERRLGAIGLSLGYGLFLSVVGTRLIFKRILGEELEPDEAAIFHVGHVVYGLTLGTWLSSREPIGEVYRLSRRMPRGLTPGLKPTLRDTNN